MKRILLLGIIIVSLFTLNVSASTKTNQRTEDNLLLPDRVLKDKVDKNDVLNFHNKLSTGEIKLLERFSEKYSKFNSEIPTFVV